MNRGIMCAFLFSLFFIPAAIHLHGEETIHHYLTSPKTIFDLPHRIDPDEPLFEYSNFEGMWKAMIGFEMILYALESEYAHFFCSVNGFFDLHNFNTDHPVPWELLRANIGFGLFFEMPPLNTLLFPHSRIFGELRCNHESDHILRFLAFENEFINGAFSLNDLDYNNFSSFDYFKLRITYQQSAFNEQFNFFVSAGTRLFVYTNPLSLREMNWSFFTEAQVSFKPVAESNVNTQLSFFYEVINNDFISGSSGQTIFAIEHNGEDYYCLIVQFAVEIKNQTGFSFIPFIKYYQGNGREADFLKEYQGVIGGVQFWI
jgi:hypothetical protein